MMGRALLFVLLVGVLSACNTILPTATVVDNGVQDILWIGDDQILTGPLDMQTLLFIELAGGGAPLQMERIINPHFNLSFAFDESKSDLGRAITENDLLIIQGFGLQRDFSDEEFEDNANSWVTTLRSKGKDVMVFYPWFTRVDSEETKNHLDELFHKVVWQQNLTMVLVGPAWEAARKARPNIQLYASDGIHPSPAGVYLTACVFYASLTGESPLDNPVYTSIGYDSPDEIVKLDGETIEFLQMIAWETISDYLKKDEFQVIIKQ